MIRDSKKQVTNLDPSLAREITHDLIKQFRLANPGITLNIPPKVLIKRCLALRLSGLGIDRFVLTLNATSTTMWLHYLTTHAPRSRELNDEFLKVKKAICKCLTATPSRFSQFQIRAYDKIGVSLGGTPGGTDDDPIGYSPGTGGGPRDYYHFPGDC
jgi:hypothetical protein